jgi:MATE family multidrug resistance protein
LTAGLRHSARRIASLAWPVLVGQLSVLAFSTVDTILVARHGVTDLAALAVGAAAYITTFIGFMGVVLAVGPIVGQLFGAGRSADAGRQFHQAIWVALLLSLVGSTLLVFPALFLALAQASPEVAGKVRGYLMALAFSLPASLLFTAYRGFNVAVSRPKAVMLIQVAGLALKLPLSAALIFGVPVLGIPELGVLGCGVATCIAMWSQVLAAAIVLRRDPFYTRFKIRGRGLDPPDARALTNQLRLGLPMGASILVEVSGFTFMALFIARLGTTQVAGHQIAANVVSMMFMVPLAIANGTSTLVAQRIGANDTQDARRLGWHGLMIGCALAGTMALALLAWRQPLLSFYTHDVAILAAALPLLGYVALFHVMDAVQVIATFVLRAYRIATLPLLINAAALWGVGLAGGFITVFHAADSLPALPRGAAGFWTAATLGLALSALALVVLLSRILRRSEGHQRAPPPAAPLRSSVAAGDQGQRQR